MLAFDEDYPMCAECGVELQSEGFGIYTCPICGDSYEIEPPTPMEARRMVSEYRYA
jgi:tRNA(Ile2) C34 agmatinyltransferase TiaS